ncbi:DeoR family transcriptional regulator [Sulfurospirillum cavolei]|uniref:DeoR family transcriptional regulator n=1 Tax=Sulfurospirillum cavolei TaxID=366522 RepID=UPI0005A721E9|nr:DeoR family transcriptional regulator [Sulfurospirillum cavolei]
MGKISSTYRVIEILKLLNDGKILCIDNLASSYDTSTRSIRRDLELIKEIFGDLLISPKKGCYQAVEKRVLNDTLNSTELYMLKNILRLSDRSHLSLATSVDNTIKKAIIKEENDSPYLFKNRPYEEIYEHKVSSAEINSSVFRKKITYRNLKQQGHFWRSMNLFFPEPYKYLNQLILLLFSHSYTYQASHSH